ncbi:hypothetical protein, partial [Flavobacterium plurextorum]|uniref:hypothetical protein n=1 Tax=Flavobacterium plurextorum TaxID=1114867 RepID=UPI001AD7F096
MTKFIKNLDGIFEVLLLMIIAGSLLNINWFFNPVFASYYAFCLFSLIFIILVLINVTRKSVELWYNQPILYLGIWSLYIVLRNTVSKIDSDTFMVYMSIISLLTLTAATVFNSVSFNLKRFF